MMEQGKSSLNPNAAPYIPLHKRKANDENKISELTEDSLKSGNETATFSPTESHHGTEKHSDASYSDIHGIGEHIIDSEVLRIGHENLSDKKEEQQVDEGSLMAIAYQVLMFPDLSEQFLYHVYTMNGGNLEDSIDLLKQLQNFHYALPEHPPDSLDTSEDLECRV